MSKVAKNDPNVTLASFTGHPDHFCSILIGIILKFSSCLFSRCYEHLDMLVFIEINTILECNQLMQSLFIPSELAQVFMQCALF